ncbi:hypothetical protein [Flavobacterium agrisoli]|uniref:Lipoprotein n=1 Tax=Flavobacterium agrisoli TaxID=2793066 RepID=A0A934PL05_9FLAO|nr:hypothetical protein [Flavobacterium agrisoli]MBK0368858.1 hypothetical protein [Flavobacterium agrisoli]
MKKIFCIAFLTLVLNGCDDGNLNVDTINFEDASVQSCTNGIIYKLNENESMLLQMPEGAIVDEPSETNTPLQYNINNSTYRVIYRAYNGTVSADNICSTIPPALPNVTDQWTATGGIIEIFTTQNTTTDETNNSTRITGYTHNIKFKNITFQKTDGPQVYNEFDFGEYVTSVAALNLSFQPSRTNQCATSKQLYNYTSSSSITIDNIDPNLIKNEVTVPGTPRTGLITSTTNKLTYKTFSEGVLSESYFCQTTTPILPVVSQTWLGVDGVANQSGVIEVVTETNGPNAFKHTITLKSTTLKKGNSTFKLGDSFLFGELNTTN